jgi:hypothetical protein
MLIQIWVGILFFFATPLHAQTSAPPAPLGAKAEAVIRSAMRVLSESEGTVTLSFPGHSFAPKTPILFFRKRNTRIEPIASATFVRESIDPKTRKKVIVVQLQMDTIQKYPIVGDYAAPMAEPGDPLDEGKGGPQYRPPVDNAQVKEENTRPGYLEFGMGLLMGSTSADPSSAVNESKRSNGYRFGTTHFLYYSDFVPIGVEFDSHSGEFPTSTYLGTVIQSSEKVSTFNFVYRFKPLFKRLLALSSRISFLSDEFMTNNIDISLINTKINATGLGLRAQLEFVSPIWKPNENQFPIRIQNLSADFIFYPSVTATDNNIISRGSDSNGSTAMQYRLSVTALAWIPFIPIFKRWVLQGSYGARIYHLSFNGPTVGEPSNPEPVPEKSTSKELENDYRFFFGFRIEDPVKLIFFGDETK